MYKKHAEDLKKLGNYRGIYLVAMYDSTSKEKRKLLKEAALGKDGPAQYEYALYFKTKNYSEYVKFMLASADNGYSKAYFYAYKIYKNSNMMDDAMYYLIEGIKILLVHGSPRRNNEDILPELTMDQVEEIIKDTTADVVLCGHTHIPCGFQTSKKQTVVNAGSIGRPFTPEPKSCYLKITITNGNCIFEHKFVEYNKDTAALKLRKRNFVGSNKLANTLLDPQLRHF